MYIQFCVSKVSWLGGRCTHSISDLELSIMYFVASVKSIQVEVCGCVNGGECIREAMLDTSSAVIVLNCICPEGKI